MNKRKILLHNRTIMIKEQIFKTVKIFKQIRKIFNKIIIQNILKTTNKTIMHILQTKTKKLNLNKNTLYLYTPKLQQTNNNYFTLSINGSVNSDVRHFP